MNRVKNTIQNVVKQTLNEYLDKNYMVPLRSFMNMDESDQAWECAARMPWLFMEFIDSNEDIYETIQTMIVEEKVPEDIFEWEDYEAAEKLSEFFKTDLRPYCEDFIEYCTNHGETDVPLFCAADFRREVHNEWLVHMTSSDNIPSLYKEGFTYGVDIDNLAYTPAIGTTNYKYGPGYNFAFYAEEASVAEKSGYGDCAILFQASGVEIYHWGDQQHQIIFYGPSARNLMFLFQDDGTNMWYVDSEITGRRLVEFDNLEFLVTWCINNFAQYYQHLVGRTNQRVRMERNYNKRQDKKVAEGIFSKYCELLFEAKATADEVWQKYYSDIDRNVFNAAVAADPTAKGGGIGKYTKWILNLAKRGQWKPGDSHETRDCLERFAKIGSKLEKKDIQQYKSVAELYQTLQDASGVKTRSETRNEGSEKVYEDDDWMIIHPMTQEAAVLYGKGTQWCTAATEYNNQFNYYNEKGPLYIIISKKYPAKKWQFHTESDSFMDVNDHRITTVNDLTQYGDTSELFDFITTNLDTKLQFFPKRRIDRANQRMANGEKLEDIFDKIENCGEGMRRVIMNGKVNYLNQDNQYISETWFDKGCDFAGGFAFVVYPDDEDDFVYSHDAGDYIHAEEGTLSKNEYDYYDDNIQSGNYINHQGYPLYNYDDDFGNIIEGDNFDKNIEGYALVQMDYDLGNGTCNILSKDGNLMLPPLYDYIKPISPNMIIVRRQSSVDDDIEGYTLVDINGRNLIGDPQSPESYFDSMDAFGESGMIKAGRSGGYVAINDNGQLINNTVFGEILGFRNGVCLVELNDRWNYMDTQGNLLFGDVKNIRRWPLNATQFSEGIAAIMPSDGKGVMFIGRDGRPLTNKRFNPPVSYFMNGFCIVTGDDELKYIINNKFETVSPGFVTIADPSQRRTGFNEGVVFVGNDKNYMNCMFALYSFKRGMYLTDYIFDMTSDFAPHQQNRPINGKYGITDLMAETKLSDISQTYLVDLNGNVYTKMTGELVKNGLTAQSQPQPKNVAEGIFAKYNCLIK